MTSSLLVKNGPLEMIADLNDLQFVMQEIRAVFRDYFDRGWLASIIEKLTLDFNELGRIRYFLQMEYLRREDIPLVYDGIRCLENYIAVVRSDLVPELREYLGISGLKRYHRGIGKNDIVMREFYAYVFPCNLDRLESLVAELKDLLERQERQPDIV